MHKKRLLLFLTLTVFLTIHCDIFEPKNEKGSISIQLVSKTDSSKLPKTQETLYTVQCIVKKGSSEIHKDDYSKNSSGDFNIEIENLEPADNYSVLLYGKNSSDDIIGRAYRNSISVTAGDETSVSMSWIEMETVTDIDGNIYQTIKIGNQWWMAENLKVTHYRNGDDIPNVTGDSEWVNLSTGARCTYNNSESNADIYGYFYNWFAVDDTRDIAPAGWHMPTDEEWKTLEKYLGMSQSEADNSGWRGTNEGSKLAGNVSLWNSGDLENNVVFGESGFSALPGGYRYGFGSGYFNSLGGYAYFWSSTQDGSTHAWYRHLRYNDSVVYRFSSDNQDGFSVRLIRD